MTANSYVKYFQYWRGNYTLRSILFVMFILINLIIIFKINNLYLFYFCKKRKYLYYLLKKSIKTNTDTIISKK